MLTQTLPIRHFKAQAIACLLLSILVDFSQAQQGNGGPPKADDLETVKVFILAGQSNMEGKAANTLLLHQATDSNTQDQFAHLRKNDDWIVRDDVFIKFLERNGGLTIGYGSPNKTGVELEFGNVMGDHFQQPVLLIKTAWGGHSLHQKFRSPSAGFPSEAQLQKELDEAVERVKKSNEKNNQDQPLPTMQQIQTVYGSSYRQMMEEVRSTMKDYPTMFPALKGKQLQLAGFVWFQGYNDMFGDGVPEQYASNMKHFINDVREDLDAPKLPFVIGCLGQNGSQPAQGAMLKVQQGQLAMNDVPEFSGNVISIRTDVLVDKEAEALFPGWQDHMEQWQKVGSDRPYHYLGSAIWFNRIGKAFGEEMLTLLAP